MRRSPGDASGPRRVNARLTLRCGERSGTRGRLSPRGGRSMTGTPRGPFADTRRERMNPARSRPRSGAPGHRLARPRASRWQHAERPDGRPISRVTASPARDVRAPRGGARKQTRTHAPPAVARGASKSQSCEALLCCAPADELPFLPCRRDRKRMDRHRGLPAASVRVGARRLALGAHHGGDQPWKWSHVAAVWMSE